MAARKPNYLMWGILLVGGYLLYEESKKTAAAPPAATLPPVLTQGNGTALPAAPSSAQTVVSPSQLADPINVVPANNFVMDPGTATAPAAAATVTAPTVVKPVPSGPAWSVRANYAR